MLTKCLGLEEERLVMQVVQKKKSGSSAGWIDLLVMRHGFNCFRDHKLNIWLEMNQIIILYSRIYSRKWKGEQTSSGLTRGGVGNQRL